MPPRIRDVSLIALVLVIAACAGGQPATSPSAPTSVAPERTQILPSRGPFPTLGMLTFPPSTPGPTSSSDPVETAVPTAPPDPELVAMLPTSIGGLALRVVSGRASDIGTGGDMCFAFCPGELQDTAKNAGADPADVTWAVASSDMHAASGVYIRAIRVPGATSDLVKAWLTDNPMLPYPTVTAIRVGERNVSLIEPPFPDSPPTYAFVTGDVLFIVVASPAPADPTHPDGIALKAIQLLA